MVIKWFTSDTGKKRNRQTSLRPENDFQNPSKTDLQQLWVKYAKTRANIFLFLSSIWYFTILRTLSCPCLSCRFLLFQCFMSCFPFYIPITSFEPPPVALYSSFLFFLDSLNLFPFFFYFPHFFNFLTHCFPSCFLTFYWFHRLFFAFHSFPSIVFIIFRFTLILLSTYFHHSYLSFRLYFCVISSVFLLSPLLFYSHRAFPLAFLVTLEAHET